MLNDVALLHSAVQVRPAVAIHAKLLARLPLRRRPPGREQTGAGGGEVHEVAEAFESVWVAGVEAPLINVAELVVVFSAEAVGVHQEGIDVLLGPVVQPGLARQPGEGVSDGRVQALRR